MGPFVSRREGAQNVWWVLEACARRVCPQAKPMQILLNYGLAKTEVVLKGEHRAVESKEQLRAALYRHLFLRHLDRLNTFTALHRLNSGSLVRVHGRAVAAPPSH
jgi:hypothetical protein